MGHRLRTIALTLVVSSLPSVALADDALLAIQPTGVEALDDVFKPVSDVLIELQAATFRLNFSTDTITAEVASNGCESTSQAVSSFSKKAKGALSVELVPMTFTLLSQDKIDAITGKYEEMGQEVPQSVLDAIPTVSIPIPTLKVNRKGRELLKVVEAVNEAVTSTVSVVKTAASIPTRMQTTVATATTLPARAPKEIKKAGITSKEDVEAVLEIVKKNVGVILKLPRVALGTLEEVKHLLSLVQGLAVGGVSGVRGATVDLESMDGFLYRKFDNGYIEFEMEEYSGCMAPTSAVGSAYQRVLAEYNQGDVG